MNSTNNRQMYTHDLSKLIGYAKAEGLALNVPKYVENHVNTITGWEAGSRYDIGFSIRIDTLKKGYEVISKWEQQIKL